MNIRIANISDIELIKKHDSHVNDEILEKKLFEATILLAFENNEYN